MTTLIIAASHQAESNSGKIAKYIQGVLGEAVIYDLGLSPLPLWSPEIADPEQETPAQVTHLQQQALQADALVCVVPEYSGMATPAFKNCLLMLSSQHLGHKPACLVAVSAGLGGAYPVAEIRMSSYKNTKIIWIPDHVIIRRAGDFPKVEHEDTIARLHYSLEVLALYSQALKEVRLNPTIQNPPFPFGM